VKIYARRDKLEGRREQISEAIHEAMKAAVNLPAEKKFHRYFPLNPEDLVTPASKSEAYMTIEILLISGRSNDDKKKLVTGLYANLSKFDFSANDVEIVIFDNPIANWGFRGLHGPDLNLGYVVDRGTKRANALRDASSQGSSLSGNAGNEDDDADIVKARNSGQRHARDYWNLGQFKPIRSTAEALNHRPSSSGANAKVRRCIVCCESCKTGKAHHRRGYKTKFGCFVCAQSAAASVNENIKDAPILPLCQIARFKDQGENRTCFEIHHSGGPYPILKCTTHEKPRLIPTNMSKRLKPAGADTGFPLPEGVDDPHPTNASRLGALPPSGLSMMDHPAHPSPPQPPGVMDTNNGNNNTQL